MTSFNTKDHEGKTKVHEGELERNPQIHQGPSGMEVRPGRPRARDRVRDTSRSPYMISFVSLRVHALGPSVSKKLTDDTIQEHRILGLGAGSGLVPLHRGNLDEPGAG